MRPDEYDFDSPITEAGFYESPPPAAVPEGGALFTDQFVEEAERAHFQAPPDGADRLVAKIINVIRRANITVSPPAHVSPIVWSDPIDLSARVTVPAAVGNYVTAVTFTCPPGRGARIKHYGVNVRDAGYTYDGSILWRWRRNGQNLGDGMSDWGEQRGSLVDPRETYIRLAEDDVLEFQVRRAVVAGAPQDVEMGFSGWTWRLRNNYEGTAASVTAW